MALGCAGAGTGRDAGLADGGPSGPGDDGGTSVDGGDAHGADGGPCRAGWALCPDVCVSLATTSDCGACGVACEGDCSSGECRPDREWVRWAVAADPKLPESYTTTADTVTDNTTGLTWQRTVPGSLLTWADAQASCAALDLAGGGWRVPTKVELASLVDRTRQSPSVNPSVFPSTPAEYTWSATLYAASTGLAWVVHFDSGASRSYDVNQSARVRCVR